MPSPYQGNQENNVIPQEGLGRFSKEEMLELRVFKDKPVLLTILRKIFYQGELLQEENDLIVSAFGGDPVLLDVVWRLFDSEVEKKEFIVGPRWSDRKYSDLLINEVKPLVLARQDSINFITVGLERLRDIAQGNDGDIHKTNVDIGMKGDYEDKSPEEVKRAVCAFQDCASHIESLLLTIRSFAEMPEETEEQRTLRDKKNSSK